ncbi:MAG: NrdH-redoxin [bacterium]|nr:NrdH-redoxin [bacterium]
MDVTVYGTATCPWCDRVKEFLSSSNIEFKYIDVSADKEAAEEMVKKSGQMGVPVIIVDEEIIVGFNQDALKKALKLD